jgi:hypothetical protein
VLSFEHQGGLPAGVVWTLKRPKEEVRKTTGGRLGRTAAFRLLQRPNDGSVPSGPPAFCRPTPCFRTLRAICPLPTRVAWPLKRPFRLLQRPNDIDGQVVPRVQLYTRCKQLFSTQTRCDRLKSRCDGRVGGANDTKIVAADQNQAARDGKTRRIPWVQLYTRCQQLFSTQTRCDRNKRSANALIAVANETNGAQTDPSQWRMKQTERKRTHRSGKRHKWTANGLIVVANDTNGLQTHVSHFGQGFSPQIPGDRRLDYGCSFVFP